MNELYRYRILILVFASAAVLTADSILKFFGL